MATIEERAVIHANKFDKEIGAHHYSYCIGASEQKVIDDTEINELKAIVELTASVMGIGTKWLNDVAKIDATMELREKIMKYYE